MRKWRIPPLVPPAVPLASHDISLSCRPLRLGPESQEDGFTKQNGEWSDPGGPGPGNPGSLHSPHARPLLSDPFGAVGSRASHRSFDVTSPKSRRTMPCP